MGRAFPSVTSGQQERLMNKGIDIESRFREWIGDLTGKEGEDLEDLIEEGKDAGREAEKEGIHGGEPSPLTKTEEAHLVLYANGYAAKDIAEECFLSIETCKSHAKNIRNKLSARNMAHAVAIGYESGILPVLSYRWEEK